MRCGVSIFGRNGDSRDFLGNRNLIGHGGIICGNSDKLELIVVRGENEGIQGHIRGDGHLGVFSILIRTEGDGLICQCIGIGKHFRCRCVLKNQLTAVEGYIDGRIRGAAKLEGRRGACYLRGTVRKGNIGGECRSGSVGIPNESAAGDVLEVDVFKSDIGYLTRAVLVRMNLYNILIRYHDVTIFEGQSHRFVILRLQVDECSTKGKGVTV